MKTYYALTVFFSLTFSLSAQTIVWQDNFETPANWSLNASSGLNGVDANLWVISDAEGGVAAGNCGVASNGNKTLHVGCQGAWCLGTGATYNAGDGGLGFIDAVTHKRTYILNNINTLNTGALSIEFDYIGIGQPGFDFGKVLYSIDGGLTWATLQTIAPAATCAGGQGLWSHFTHALPVSCQNITTLKIGFEWVNDNDGNGTDPSLAINNVAITTPAANVTASFGFQNNICPGDCVDFTNTCSGASLFMWDFGNGNTSMSPIPPSICYNNPGVYAVQLVACAGNVCDTMIQSLIVNNYLFGQQNVSATGSYTWPFNGMTYLQSGSYTDTMANPNDCDSILTLNLILTVGGISEFQEVEQHIIRYLDLMGREIERRKNTMVLIQYEGGNVRRVFLTE